MKNISAWLACWALGACAIPAFADVRTDCEKDLDSLPSFLLANDAGGRNAWDRLTPAHFDDAMRRARATLSSVTDEAGCNQALRVYLSQWRRGHLLLLGQDGDGNPPTATGTAPRVEWLSAHTVVLVFPTFEPAVRDAVARLLADNRGELAKRGNWIIDVRGNGGGSDDVYLPILRWIAPAGLHVQVEYLATAANIDATRQVCALLASGGDFCEKAMRAERERLQSATPGSYVLQYPGSAVTELRLDNPEPIRPKQVAILVDEGCASSCEQFLLTARQGFAVKLVGQHSRGMLDYSNMRPHVLPTGRRTLMYAVTRSARIPAMPVDDIGVMPDVFVPPDQMEFQRAELIAGVRRWMEGGALIGN
jgi:hypothetical protein